jgi:amiloride-sensitive sodium channel subunit alpha/amiloride-sensitive sodium channel subunit gamma
MHFYYEIFTKDNYIGKNCIPHCPLECKSIQLSTTVSSSKYPNDNYFEILKNNENLQRGVFKSGNWSHIKNSILKVNINYESLSYKYIKENAVMSVIDLLAYIGGQMGLFLGISFLSFVEIFEIFIEILYIILKRNIV